MLPPRPRPPMLPWERRQEAERREYAALFTRFEQRLLAALDAHDERPTARRAAARAAFAAQLAERAVTRAHTLERRVEAAAQRTAALAALAYRVRREVRQRLLVVALVVPATFAGWLWLAWVLAGR